MTEADSSRKLPGQRASREAAAAAQLVTQVVADAAETATQRELDRALAAAHERGVVHRDLKPDNIFLSIDEEGRMVPKLLDFGVSKFQKDDQNLALTMAQNGQRTLLVGCNLRRPSIYRFFGIEREPGLSDILVGNAQWRECIRTVADILMGRFEMEDIMASPGLDNLHIIEAGPIPANPSELLSTSAMGEFLRAVSAEYDVRRHARSMSRSWQRASAAITGCGDFPMSVGRREPDVGRRRLRCVRRRTLRRG